MLLYAVILALCSLWPLRGRSAAVLLGAFGLAIAAIALIELLRTLGATEGIQYFDEARFAEPVGYVNANAALWMSAMLPCGVLAGRRRALVSCSAPPGCWPARRCSVRAAAG